MMSKARLGAAACALAIAGWAGAGSAPAVAQSRAELISLGRSATSGAVCQAVRDYDDPVVQAQGRRAWTIRCQGWDVALGRLYALPDAAAQSAWTSALAKRANCMDGRSQPLAGLGQASRRACQAGAANAAYLAYTARRGSATYAAEGAAPIADVLETGLRVVAGAASPPKASDLQTSAASAEIAADFGGAAGGLARAEAAAKADPLRLRARAYVQNNEWRFDAAETDFQALVADADARNAPPRERAEALLNLALNVSNNGRYAEADTLLKEADAQVAAANDPLMRAVALNYRALHLRNQARFADAVQAAQQALTARQQVRADRGMGAGGPALIRTAAGQVVIGADLAHALNTRSAGRDLIGSAQGASPADQLMIQDVQADEIIGTSLAAQGNAAGARQALDRAQGRLAAAQATNGVLTVWLSARVEADLAALDLAAGQAGPAADRFARAVQILRRRHAGTSAEAGLLLELGEAQIAAGRQDAALVSYGRAFDLFQDQRGSLGASADAAQPYFDLLLTRLASDPAHADDYDARFFTAAETVVSNATAQTVSRLAARVASGDDATTGLVRALDDTRRQLRATEAQIVTLQAQGAYTGQAKTDADTQLAAFQAQSDTLEGELLAANPRYAQLVSSNTALKDLQKALRPGEAYAKIVLLGGRSYGMLITRDAARPYAIALTRDAAAAAAQSLRKPFESETSLPRFDVAGSHALFVQLFGPVQAELTAVKHLVYEPDGALISLPPAIFVVDDASVALMRSRMVPGAVPDYRGIHWLGQSADSSLVLSAASFLQSRAFKPSQAKLPYLAFGDPDLPKGDPRAFGSLIQRGGQRSGVLQSVCEGARQALMQLPPLPDTADEVKRVGASIGAPGDTVVLGDAFSDSAVIARKDLANYKVLYFATHGILPQPSACLPEPALVTSLGPGDSDGLLDASEILQLKLDADLVVLSACDTGGAGSQGADRTGLQGGGEALGGLTRAVIYAGGRALVVSHWSVDSEATLRLMTGLFGSTAPSEAEALQRAQAILQDNPQWSHPYYWAPFTIVGDGARALPTASGRGA